MKHSITVLHTNDLHNRLLPAQAARLRTLRSDLGDACLLVDAGDAVSSGNITFRPGGEPILDTLTEVGYDAMAVGNREFHFSEVGFRTKVERARFPVLCANVRARGGASEPPVQPYAAFTLRDGLRVTIVGLTVPMITERMLASRLSAYVFDDPIACAARLVPELRPSCDLLICLTHIGLARDALLAGRVPGIDLVIGGHTHAILEHGQASGGAVIAQAGSFGRYVGRIEIETDGRTHEISPGIEPL